MICPDRPFHKRCDLPLAHEGKLQTLMHPILRLAFHGLCCAVACAPCLLPHETSSTDEPPETARFLRPSGTEWVAESEIQLREMKDGLVITSVTGREKSNLKLVARFDSDNRLVEATVTTERGDEKQSAGVAVTHDKARVTRHGAENTELDCPRGVLVTSAPDWTDAFLMVRRYDRARGGKQEFAGLWIHPTQQPLRPTFTITRQGEDTIEHQGESVRLDRYAITLRGGSRYVGWSDARGRLVRLVPQASPRGGIVLEGWERVADKLRVPEK